MTKRSALVSGVIFAGLMAVFYSFQYGVLRGVLEGAAVGLVYGIAMYFVINSGWFKKKTAIEIDNGEPVVMDGGANHFLNGEAVGGKLYLTHDQLRFKSHKFNIQNHELLMNVHDIKQVGFYNIAGIIRNGIQVTMNTGKTEKFVVNKREQWVSEIEKVKAP